MGDAQHAKLVFKIRCEDADEERVLLRILSEVEKSYEAKYKKKIDEAR